MKAATGELQLTVITMIALAAIIGFFWFFWPTIQNSITNEWSDLNSSSSGTQGSSKYKGTYNEIPN